MQSVTTLPMLSGARVLLRVDYNVPLQKERILDTRRIESSYESIDIIIKKEGTPILLAHLGDGEESLRPIATFLSKRYNVVFITHDVFDRSIDELLAQVPSRTVILLENVRRYKEEEKNSTSFAKALAALGTYYVNDAFSVSHRAHASIVGIPSLLPSFTGIQLMKEIKALDTVIQAKDHPFLFILGGSKFSTKIPLLERFSTTVDGLVIAGAIMNTFYKTAGFPVGTSVVEDGYEKIITPLLRSPKLLLPIDVVVERLGKEVILSPEEIEGTDMIVDIGPKSVALIQERIKKAKVIVWNGPTGWYEKGYTKGTKLLAQAIIERNVPSVIGGGDTGAAIESLLQGKTAKNVFISTGGGATLEYLAKGTLPGIDCL